MPPMPGTGVRSDGNATLFSELGKARPRMGETADSLLDCTHVTWPYTFTASNLKHAAIQVLSTCSLILLYLFGKRFIVTSGCRLRIRSVDKILSHVLHEAVFFFRPKCPNNNCPSRVSLYFLCPRVSLMRDSESCWDVFKI